MIHAHMSNSKFIKLCKKVHYVGGLLLLVMVTTLNHANNLLSIPDSSSIQL